MTVAPRFAADPRRRAMIGKVKIAQKELGLDDAAYRAMLVRITGRESAANCNEGQLGLVLDELKAKGWVPRLTSGKPESRKARKPAAADHSSAKKARALWISLYQLGEVRNRSEASLEAFARRQLHVEQLQWADQSQCFRLIEALKAMAERAGWSQDLAGVADAFHVVTLKRRLLVLLCAKGGAVVPECGDEQLDMWIKLAADLPSKEGDHAAAT